MATCSKNAHISDFIQLEGDCVYKHGDTFKFQCAVWSEEVSLVPWFKRAGPIGTEEWKTSGFI